MKQRILLFFCCLTLPLAGFCQADSIFLHSGAAMGVEIREVLPLTITYVAADGKTQKAISKRAVQRVVYGNGTKMEDVSPFISVQGEGDWEKVVLLNDESEAGGLSYSGEINAQGGGKFIDSTQANARALLQLKKEAANRKCPYLFINESHMKEAGYVGRLVKKSAVGYKY